MGELQMVDQVQVGHKKGAGDPGCTLPYYNQEETSGHAVVV